jgi:hypothetical protein
MSYLKIPIELSGAALKADMYAAMQEAFPTWESYDGNPEKRIIDALIDRLVVPLAQLISDVPDQALQKLGEQVHRIPAIEAAAATVSSTWKFTTTEGLTILAGTTVNLPISADQQEGFVVVADVEVPAGKAETEAGEVLLEAINTGAQANDLSGPAELVDSLLFFDEIALVGETAGGVDAEDPLVYLARLTETLQIQAPRPVLARDVPILVRSVPGVQRVAALDNYDAESEEGELEKTISLAAIDLDGDPVGVSVKEEIEALLEEKREANFVFVLVDPAYTELDFLYEIVPREGFDQTATEEAVAAAIEAAYSPAIFGVDPSAQEEPPTTWVNADTLRFQDLVTLVNNVQGVEHFSSLKWGESGGELDTEDIVLTGAFPLPKVGAVEVGS